MGIRKIIDRRDFEPVLRLGPGVTADDAVAYIVGPKPGTGFLVAADRVMTNNHVLADPETARESTARFGYWRQSDGTISDGAEVTLDPDSYFHTDPELDFTVVALAAPVAWEPLDIRSEARIDVGKRVYVIGHPRGRPMEFVQKDTEVTRVDGPFVGYRADTERQSSGSPVFDTSWRLVAIHHRSAQAGQDARGNEGVLMTSIAAAWR